MVIRQFKPYFGEKVLPAFRQGIHPISWNGIKAYLVISFQSTTGGYEKNICYESSFRSVPHRCAGIRADRLHVEAQAVPYRQIQTGRATNGSQEQTHQVYGYYERLLVSTVKSIKKPL